MIDTGSLAEWAIATSIMMYSLGRTVNVEADSQSTVKYILIAWLVCGIVFVFLAGTALVTLFLN